MNYILFDDISWKQLQPLTFTRPVAEIRVGILTIKEKWNKYLDAELSHKTQNYLQEKYPLKINNDNIFINGSLLPTPELVLEVKNLDKNQVLKCGEVICAARVDKDTAKTFTPNEHCCKNSIETSSVCTKINWSYEIFGFNGKCISDDFKLVTKNKTSQNISKTNTIIGSNDIFIDKGAKVECAILNTSDGPIYIGKDAEVMENSAIRGPFALCNNSTVKMSAKIYSSTTIGPHSKVGGELNNVVVFGYSNKAHDGFLGNSVIGEWCNLGADTNNSNLKNNYANVKLWNYIDEHFVSTNLQFCGLIMGDHSKCGINTMFNTGTVVGVAANIFGDGFPRNFIPSFSWGGAHGFSECRLNKAYETATLVMKRRGLEFDEKEQKIINEVFELTKRYRESFS